jgi:aminoglycoside phosphotransferase family enzyme
MANPRQDRSIESATEQAGKVTEEEATRATRNVADFSERAARTNLDMFQSGMETARHVWESSAELTSSLTRRTTDEFGRALGLAGEGTEETAQKASRNVSAIAQTNQALNEGVRKVSDEWFKFA